MSLFRDTTIRDRVMATVEARIKGAQEAYDLGCENLESQMEDDKKDLADSLVNSIFHVK